MPVQDLAAVVLAFAETKDHFAHSVTYTDGPVAAKSSAYDWNSTYYFSKISVNY